MHRSQLCACVNEARDLGLLLWGVACIFAGVAKSQGLRNLELSQRRLAALYCARDNFD